MVTRSFYVADIMAAEFPLIYYLPGIFIGFLMVLTIKLRNHRSTSRPRTTRTRRS